MSAEGAETKAPKKKVKRRSGGFTGMHTTSSWGPRPMRHEAAKTHKVSPIAIVLATARAQIGKPYVWGSAGPNTFDCSGFTMFSWHAAGVSLPHNSSAQYASTKHVSLKDAKPGDLVFSPGHVGLYIGDGKMINSPHSGARVEIVPIHPSTYGVGRPLG